MIKLKDYLATIVWSIKLALKINFKVLIFYIFFCGLISVLPSISLIYNRESVSIISQFIITGEGSFNDVLPSILILGLLTLLLTLSSRINYDFLWLCCKLKLKVIGEFGIVEVNHMKVLKSKLHQPLVSITMLIGARNRKSRSSTW